MDKSKEVMVSVPLERYTKLLETEANFLVLQKIVNDLNRIINDNRKVGPTTEIIIQKVTTDES